MKRPSAPSSDTGDYNDSGHRHAADATPSPPPTTTSSPSKKAKKSPSKAQSSSYSYKDRKVDPSSLKGKMIVHLLKVAAKHVDRAEMERLVRSLTISLNQEGRDLTRVADE